MFHSGTSTGSADFDRLRRLKGILVAAATGHALDQRPATIGVQQGAAALVG